MPELKINTAAAALAMSVGLAILQPSCWTPSREPFGFCRVDADCVSEKNFQGWGTVCDDGMCRCENVSDEVCCSNGEPTCERRDIACRLPEDCHPCKTDDECPPVPDTRCGSSRCADGRCQVEILRRPPMPSQYPGDCKTMLCDAEGKGSLPLTEESADLNDVPVDGNPCTVDTCDGYHTYHEDIPDGEPCPGEGSGICVAGRCVECNEAVYPACPDGLVCDGSFCVPSACKDAVMNGEETYTDCGGPDCRPCSPKLSCLEGRDCISGVCANNVCQIPTSNDGVKNGLETGVDCGSYEGPPNTCADGEGCNSRYNCMSSVCYDGLCLAPTCFDAVKNGEETGTDCGGDCPSCPS